MKLCVFPNDPIISYYKKGEIKKRYFNPKNFFDQISIISFIDKDVEESKIQEIVGTAKLKIYSVGKVKIQQRKQHLDRIIKLVKDIDPDVIRAYNVRLEGWFASKCSMASNKPFYLSLHTQPDHIRKALRKSNFKKYLISKYMEKTIEPFVLQSANRITVVHKVIASYVKKHSNKIPKLIYNKVDLSQFANSYYLEDLPTKFVLAVGTLIKERNTDCIIKAMKGLDAHCIIIGKGEEYNNLQKLISKEKLEKKIHIINSIPHDKIQNYFKSASVFVSATNPELGLPIPVMEALATGLPIVTPIQKDKYSNGLDGIVLFSKIEPKSYNDNIKKILTDSKLRSDLAKNALKKAKDFTESRIEECEAQIYSDLVGKL